ncbi:unnamed protein product [Acanthosepion pharaonis]|uniref:Uncharacterized protein n=1 Tax=Acanthosepion pharaonis TaxID=158019 RepID=A0A812DYQ1_ACAPH|nr:unnamed protein product [Sepia pharaonis]
MNEIQDFLAERVISSIEGPWHIFSFPIHERFPAIFQLAVHLENGVLRYFSADTAMDVVACNKDTTLTASSKLCKQDEFARTLLYSDVRSYYVWTNKDTWAGGSAGVRGQLRGLSRCQKKRHAWKGINGPPLKPSRRPRIHKRSVPPACPGKLPTGFCYDQGSRINTQAASTASASRASETHHQRLVRNVRNAAATATSRAIETLDRRRAHQSRDAAATESARAAVTQLRRSCRNARNTATTAMSKHLTAGAPVNPGTLLQQLGRGSCSGQHAMPATLQRRLLPKTRANRLSRAAINIAAVALISNSPSSPHTPRRQHSTPCCRP